MIKSKFTDEELAILEEKYCKSAQSILQVQSGPLVDLREKIFKETEFLPTDIKLKVRLWHILNDEDELPICSVCNTQYSAVSEKLRIKSPTDFFPYIEHCSDKKRIWNTKSFIAESKRLFPEMLTYNDSQYVDMHTKVKFHCISHNIDFEQTPLNHINSTTPCPECKKEWLSETNRRSKEEWIDLFRSMWGDEYDYSMIGEITNAKTRFYVVCKKHGPWETSAFNHHTEQHGCVKCTYEAFENGSHCRSKEEIQVYDYVRSILPGVEVNHSNRLMLDGREMDIWIPSLKVGIEYNGIYCHSTARSNIHKNHHINKTKRADTRGIRLIHIFSDEWKHKRAIVERKLKNILGCDDSKRVYARSTVAAQSTNSEVKELYEGNHIQGHLSTASYVCVLKKDGEIVAAMSFRKIGDTEWELSRYATSCNVIGGFTKLLSFFKKKHPDWSKIITFADRRWSNGDVYRNTGFTEVSKSPPYYSYVIGTRRFNRQQFTHQRMSQKLENYDPNKSEFENMDAHGIPRIYDCGLIKFEMTNTKKGS